MNFLEIKTEEDISNLSNLASEIWNEYWTVILSQAQIDYMIDKFQSYYAIKNQIENEKYTYNILSLNRNNIGYFGIANKENYLFLSKLYIKNGYRNLGYGKLAFEKIKQFAQLYDKNSIILTVNKNNTNTINAYKSWGFKTIDSVVTDIGNGFVMDDYIMEFKLQEN